MSFEHHIAKALMPDECDLDFTKILCHVVLHARYGSSEAPEAHSPEAIASEWVGGPMNEDQRRFARELLAAMYHNLATPEEAEREQAVVT